MREDFATSEERAALDRMRRTIENSEYYRAVVGLIPWCSSFPPDARTFLVLAVEEEMTRVGEAALEAGAKGDDLMSLDIFDAVARFCEAHPELDSIIERTFDYYLRQDSAFRSNSCKLKL